MSREILIKGLDVSTHQGVVDWKKVKAQGYKFVMIRVGYRGYANGIINDDKCFLSNIKGALKVGMYVGAYYYSTAINEEEAIEDANYVLNKVNGYEISLPLVFDFEGYKETKYRTYGMTKAQRTACCKAFIDTIEANGYKSMLYGSKGNIRTTYDTTTLLQNMWIAKYAGGYTKILSDDKYFPDMGDAYNSRIAIWQYTSIGSVDGISGNVDLDFMYIDITNNPYKTPTKVVKQNILTNYIALDTVKWLQWELRHCGYDLEVDGKFGKLTLNALKDYQSTHGIEVDGKCGKLTRICLLND